MEERPPSASSPASRFVTRFIAFSIGMPVDVPSGFSSRSTPAPVAFTVTRAEISSVRPEHITRAHADDAAAAGGVDQRRDRLDMIRQHGAVFRRGQRRTTR